MTTDTFSPLKLLLFGEHSVTKGEKCIAIAINKFGYFTATKSLQPSITVVDANNTKIDLSYLVNYSNTNEEVIINLQKSIGCGLGTSASVSTLLAKYFSENKNKVNSKYQYILDEKTKIEKVNDITLKNNDLYEIKNSKILNIALEIENIFHGKSSGVDVTTVFSTGLIIYQNYKCTKLNTKYIKKYKTLIYDSKIKKDTAEVINKTNQHNKNLLTNKDDIYVRMGVIAEKAYKLIQSDFSLDQMHHLIKENHDLLYELGVVPAEMQKEVLRLRAKGIESKITGAGCGGHLFTIVDKNTEIDNWEEIEIYEE